MDDPLWAFTVLRSADALAGARRDVGRYLTAWGRRDATSSVLALTLPLVESAAAAGDQVHLRLWNLAGGVRVEVGATRGGVSWRHAAEELETWRLRVGVSTVSRQRCGACHAPAADVVWFEVDASTWARPERQRVEHRMPGLAQA
jgi:hypothetical protein